MLDNLPDSTAAAIKCSHPARGRGERGQARPTFRNAYSAAQQEEQGGPGGIDVTMVWASFVAPSKGAGKAAQLWMCCLALYIGNEGHKLAL